MNNFNEIINKDKYMFGEDLAQIEVVLFELIITMNNSSVFNLVLSILNQIFTQKK